MKNKRSRWTLLLLCAIALVPLLAATSFRDGVYRVVNRAVPSLQQRVNDDLAETIQKSDFNQAKLLVARGADVNYVRNGKSALDNAIQVKRADIALFLVQNGADPNHRTSPANSTPFFRAATTLNSSQLVMEMLQRGARTEIAPGTKDETVLLSALHNGKMKSAEILILTGTDVSTRMSNVRREDRTPLMLAAENGSVKVTQMLLARGDDPNAVLTSWSHTGVSALMFATYGRNAEVVEILLEHGANPNLVPRLLADDYSNLPLIQAMIRYDGEPPLIWHRQRRMVRALLRYGADVNKGNQDWLPLANVCMRFAPDLAQEFLQRGAKVNWQNKSGWSALMSAAVVGDLPTVKLLLQAGANKKLRDENGKTALDYARREKHLDVVRVLE